MELGGFFLKLFSVENSLIGVWIKGGGGGRTFDV